jgi:branched-subunit amino acid transport protein
MMSYLLLVILGMSLVTLVPRWLPVWIVDRVVLPGWMREWLGYIPYAALGALIFPGILSVEPGRAWIGLVAGIVAAVIAFFRAPIFFVVFGAILTVIVSKAFF